LNVQQRLSEGEFILKQGKVIYICNRKGGTGKTTIAVILAQTAIEADLNVAIYDMDPQQDFFDFMKYQGCRALANINDVNVARYDGKTDLIIIDTPPAKYVKETQNTVRSDFVLIPVSHSLRALECATDAMDKGSVGVVLNFPNPRSKFEREILAAANQCCFVLGVVTQYERIRENITMGKPWYTGLRDYQKEPYYIFMTNLIKEIKE
jgi:cellulose biosynthesis protein BcsQ